MFRHNRLSQVIQIRLATCGLTHAILTRTTIFLKFFFSNGAPHKATIEVEIFRPMICPRNKKPPYLKLLHRLRSWKRSIMHRLVEAKLIHKINHDQYRKKVIQIYSGHQGALLVRSSRLSGHSRYGDRLFRRRQFDLRGVNNILDIGSGAGQVLSHLIKYSSHSARITGIDISRTMLERAKSRLGSNRPRLVVGDFARLPFADCAFDCITCCYVLEHLPDARQGLEEVARVLAPGGRVLLFVTEDNFSGAWTSRFWKCRTHNRDELFDLCEALGLELKKELWFTRLHRLFRAGGICVELIKTPLSLQLDDEEKWAAPTGDTSIGSPQTGSLPSPSIQVLQSEPVEGETSVAIRTRSIVSSN